MNNVLEPSIALVVLNYNDSDRTIAVCQQAFQTGLFSSFIVVNNQGLESELKKLQDFERSQAIPGFTLLISPNNVGYCSGCNLGLAFAINQTSSSVVFLINSDVSFDRACVEKCCHKMDHYPQIGAVAPLMKKPDGQLDINWGILPSFQDGLNSIFYFGQKRFSAKQTSSVKIDPNAEIVSVPWIRSSFLALRSNALKESGLFDESFFLYCGEYSLFTRLKEKGYSGALIPACSYVHNHFDHSTWKKLHRTKVGSVRSMYLYLSKYQKIHWWQKAIWKMLSPFAIFEYDLLYWRISLKKKKR
jgi:N-acetylglucosaminyl-diphospho-decaprenol L-rhamnosyltransferase